MWIWPFFIGLAIGLLSAAMVAKEILRRQLRAFRAAERRARAAERMAEIGSMTGGLAHEIKNPLSTIGLNAQLLAEAVADLTLPADQKPRLINRTAALKRETDRLRDILTDFLEFAGQMRLEQRPVDINEVVGELADFFHPEADRFGVRILTQLGTGSGTTPGGGPSGGRAAALAGGLTAMITGPDPNASGKPMIVQADVRLLKQALLNLMINAVQAMAGEGNPAAPLSNKGQLILRTERTTDEARHPVIKLHVIDTGPGIPPEAQSRLFVPYFTTKAGGSGLGLPTSRRIINEHGGRLEVHSELGVGTDFCITLPQDGGGLSAGQSTPKANRDGR